MLAPVILLLCISVFDLAPTLAQGKRGQTAGSAGNASTEYSDTIWIFRRHGFEKSGDAFRVRASERTQQRVVNGAEKGGVGPVSRAGVMMAP